MALTNAYQVKYREVQRVTQWWVWGLVLLLAAFAVWGFVQQVVFDKPFGSHPAPDLAVVILLIVFGLGLPAFLLSFHLKVDVTDEAIRLRVFPIWSRTISLSNIRECRPRVYRPLLEYGGWGIRWTPHRGWAYNVSGNGGVQLTLAKGRPVLIGSQQPEQLAAAIAAAMGC